MIKRFEGKVVIVTGSSSGIGQATAVLFAAEGAKLTITGRNEKTLEETHQLLLDVGIPETDILSIQGDIVKDEVQHRLIDETVAKFGRLDVLVNNAGGVPPAQPGAPGGELEQTVESFDFVMNLNTRSVLTLTKLALPHLIASKGEVVMVSSMAGLKLACTRSTYYAMSKAAIDQMTRAMAVKYIVDGVRVNAVNPGLIHTPIFEKSGLPAPLVEKMAVNMGSDRKLIPLGRCGLPQDVAKAIAFLADRKSSEFIVGQTLVADGGTSLLNPLMQADFKEYL